MHTNSLDPKSQQALEKLVAQCDFLKLDLSSAVYPQAQGSGIPILLVETPLCSARVSLQGAQLLEFKAIDGTPLLWLSPNCDFTPGTALRGGIPLCLPWFGVYAPDPSKPKHGFARNNVWQLASALARVDGAVELGFLFVSDASPLFPYDFSAELRMILGSSIRLELTINNTDDQDFECSWVMHSYFRVESLPQVKVPQLAGREYKDNFENFARKTQADALDFPGPVDRVFLGIEELLRVENNPAITITHHNCPSVVTWNPGSAAAAKIADIGAGQEAGFVCVERGAVHEESWQLAAGTSQSAWMEISQAH